MEFSGQQICLCFYLINILDSLVCWNTHVERYSDILLDFLHYAVA